MSAHDTIADLPPFKIEFLPLQAIFDDFVLFFCSKLASKVSIEAH
jgi:5-methylcytosine-specific restriction endonuclease McrBC regulatory subunit McrC